MVVAVEVGFAKPEGRTSSAQPCHVRVGKVGGRYLVKSCPVYRLSESLRLNCRRVR